jgi:hypothetical protein
MTKPGSDVQRFASEEHTADRLPRAVARSGSRARSERRESSPYAHKFRVATAILVGLAIGAGVIAVTLSSGGKSAGPVTAWSSWSPPDSGVLGARDIADHLAPLYRISAVDQLSVVTVVNLANSSAAQAAAAQGTTVPGLQVAVQADPRSSAVSLLGGNTIAYDLCGIGGTNCAIGVGAASAARLLLLRREALELALYTFKYVAGTDNVVAILPPGHTSCTGICPTPNSSAKSTPLDVAVLFLKSELKPWLDQPLADTLPEEFPPTVDEMESAPEAGLVSQITAPGLFSESLVNAQDGSSLIELKPVAPQ